MNSTTAFIDSIWRGSYHLSRRRGLPTINLERLHHVQRVLLVTDGTLTDVLSAVFLEPIELAHCDQRRGTAGESAAHLDCAPDEPVLKRHVVLSGAKSGTRYLQAESVIAVDRLTPALRNAVEAQDRPIGRAMAEARVETFRELLDIRNGVGPAPSAFGPDTQAWLSRTYRIFSSGRPIILIREDFPETFTIPPVGGRH